LLGRWLAQRQAALREVLAAGARSTRFVYSVRADDFLSTFRAMKTVSGNRGGLAIKGCQPVRLDHHHDRLTACRTKAGEPSQLSTGFTFRGDALKGCSEGGWRSGRRRSGEVGGGVTGFNFQFRTCRSLVEHLLCHELELTLACSRFSFRLSDEL